MKTTKDYSVPVLSQVHAKTKHTSRIEAWRNFAQRITKNPFVKTFLMQRDGVICVWCQGKLHKSTVHHVCYDHICSYNSVLTIKTPTEQRPDKTRVVPDCESCKKDNELRFLDCMNKLMLVHQGCNKKIADMGRALDAHEAAL